jgi:mannose-6-phosphate isomerase-like protein (cupin superfamily)
MTMEKIVIYKPWGREEIWFTDDDYRLKMLVIEGGKRTSLHCHEGKGERFLIVYGYGLIEMDGMEKRVSFGDVIDIGVKVKHRVMGGGDEMRLVEVSSRKSDDVVRFADDYGRVE